MNEIADKAGFQSLAYIEDLYADYRRDPQSVSEAWRQFFAKQDNGQAPNGVQLAPSFKPRSLFSPNIEPGARPAQQTFKLDPRAAGVTERLYQLIRNHRVRGHNIASVDPLGSRCPCPPELALEFYGFSEGELNLLVNLPTLHYGTPLTVREIFQRLRETYCGSIGVQYMHIDDLSVRQWLERRLEDPQYQRRLTRDQQLRILTRLTDAVVFEEFLRKKFLGAKTFSLEGCETLLPLLDLAIEESGRQGVQNIVMGMAHRGRLNVLAHIVGKDPRDIFSEFADQEPELWEGRGDVKYHLGHAGEWTTADGRNIHVSLCFNPSHLEFVNPVVVGRVRAQQDRLGDRDRCRVMGLTIHGDAAFAGEGVVQETLNLMRLGGYKVGGILHVVINNQIGFTTLPDEGRSTIYATDIARMLQVPIFHVNGEEPEAVAQVLRLALDFRHEFQIDVFIDMYGYRRWGHNESDEPSFTQPVLYRKIAERPTVRESYLARLLALKSISREEAEEIGRSRHEKLDQQLNAVRSRQYKPSSPPPAEGRDAQQRELIEPIAPQGELRGPWRGHHGGPEPPEEPETGVSADRLAPLLRKLTIVPAGFHIHPKLKHGLETRRAMADGKHSLDWSAGEALAFATLATEGVRIRLAGQDSPRGTFSQRHAVFYDQKDGHPFMPMAHLADGQATVEIVNSPLCETAALGFEYGYSLDLPDALVLWEAQFGDFVNAAQVIVDQFISSAEDKWRRLSGLVLLLPHGFEGMGPEHSSARLERFLALSAEDNIQVVQPSTPAQYFHVLRRQALRRWRKPLVVLTPKSLLRHSEAVSSLEQFAKGNFRRILPDATEPHRVRRILLCSGKVYYDLADYRKKHQRDDVAILRLEQLYPLHMELMDTALTPYPAGTPILWVQEEPANMGAWRFLHEQFGKHLLGRFPFALISRFESASPATGSSHAHKLEQAHLVARAFGDREPDAAQVFAPKAAPTENQTSEARRQSAG